MSKFRLVWIVYALMLLLSVGVAVGQSGTKMFIVGTDGDDVNEYHCSTAFDVSTCTYDSNFDISGQETIPIGIAFNLDGTKMFIVGQTGDDVNEYHCSTAFDVSTCTYDSNFDISGQETAPIGFTFNLDGTKMFVVGAIGVDVNEYHCSTGFDVSTCSYDSVFSVSAQDTAPRGIAFNLNGTKMFIVGSTGDDVNEYHCSTGFDVSTCSYDSVFSVSAQDTTPEGIAFNLDGTKMFIVGGAGDDVNEYHCSTGFDVSTCSYDSVFSVSAQESAPFGIAFNLGFEPIPVGDYEVDFDGVEVVTGNVLDISGGSIVLEDNESRSSTILGNESIMLGNGTYTGVLSLTNYTDKTFSFVVEGENKTVTITDIGDAELNVAVRTFVGNASVSNFTGWVSNSDYSFNQSFSTTTGSVSVPLKKDLEYYLYIDPTGYALFNNTLEFNLSTTSYNYTLYVYDLNSIDIEFRDALSKSLITENITINFIGDVASYENSTTTGLLNVSLLVPTDYILRYNSNSTYDEHFYWFTLTNRTYNTLTLYLLNNTDSDVLTVTIIDESAFVVEGAVVKSLKYDVATNTYIVQEVKETDVIGEVVFNVRKNSEFYRFMIEIDGVLVRTTNPAYITSDTLTIQVVSTEVVAGEYFDLLDIISSISFNNLTNNFRAEYNDANNIGSVYCFKVTELGRSPVVVNESCSTSSSGVILLNVAVENSTIYEAELYLRINPYQSIGLFIYEHNPSGLLEGFDELGLLLQIIITVFFIFVYIINPSVGAIMIPISLVLGRLLGLHSIGFIYIAPLIVVGLVVSYLTRRQ